LTAHGSSGHRPSSLSRTRRCRRATSGHCPDDDGGNAPDDPAAGDEPHKLEKIMAEQRVFGEPERAGLVNEEKVELFRQRIKIDVVRGTAFRIGFDYENPKKAMDVTTSSLQFHCGNLKIREDHALGTSQFLQDELEVMRKRLEEKEEMIKQYSQRYLEACPRTLQQSQHPSEAPDPLGPAQHQSDGCGGEAADPSAANGRGENDAGADGGFLFRDSFARAEPQDIPRFEGSSPGSRPSTRRATPMSGG